MKGCRSKSLLILATVLALTVGDSVNEDVDKDQQTVNAISIFSVKLAKDLLQTKPGNIVVEPLGVSTVLGELLQGVAPNTSTSFEIQNVLNRNVSESRHIGKIGQDVQNTRSATTEVLIGSKLFVAEGQKVRDRFKKFVLDYFNSDVTSVPFTQSAQAADVINNWAYRSTKGKVPQIITPGVLSPDTRLVLANAAYFKGVWQSAFTKSLTHPDSFYPNERQRIDVWMMHQKATLPANVDSITGSWWVRLPVSEKHAVVFVLPSRRFGLDEVIQKLSVESISDMARTTLKRTVDLALPKFSVESSQSLKPTLQKLGVKAIFDRSSKLLGILEDNSQPLVVSDVLHRGKMEIDEKGVTAAAVSAAVVNTLTLASYSDDVVLKFDHPFLAIVVDQNSGLPIFLARIAYPTPNENP